MSDSEDEGVEAIAKNHLKQLLGIVAKLVPDSVGTLGEEGKAVVAQGTCLYHN
jgi:hypothetical protein